MIKTGIYGLLRILTLSGPAGCVVGLAACGRGWRFRGARGAVRAGPAGPEAAAGVQQRREHRHHRAGTGGRARGPELRWPAAGDVGLRRGAAASVQPRPVQEPAVSRGRGRPPRHGHAADGPAWRSHEAHAADGRAVLARCGGDRGLAAAERFRQRVADLPGRVSRGDRAARHGGRRRAGGGADAGSDRRPGGGRLHEGLRHRVPGNRTNPQAERAHEAELGLRCRRRSWRRLSGDRPGGPVGHAGFGSRRSHRDGSASGPATSPPRVCRRRADRSGWRRRRAVCADRGPCTGAPRPAGGTRRHPGPHLGLRLCAAHRPHAIQRASFTQPLADLFRLLLHTRRHSRGPSGPFPQQAALSTRTPDIFQENLFHLAYTGGRVASVGFAGCSTAVCSFTCSTSP